MASSERKRSHSNGLPKVVAHWKHTNVVSPAFIRLMTMLLQERIGNGEKRRESNRPDNSVL